MQSINSYLTDDHGTLDSLFEEFQSSKDQDTKTANDFLSRFTSALNRHLDWEEKILFPLYQQKVGEAALIRTLLAEHQEIRQWLSALSVKISQGDTDSSDEEHMLVEELGGHNAREEYALYPQLDKLLTDEEKTQVFKAIAETEV